MIVELLTPLHIGTGNDIPEFEYQLDGSQLLRISLSSLIASDPGAVDFLNDFSTRDGIDSYLKSRSSRWDDHLLYFLNGEALAFDESRQRDTAVRECIKASLGNYPLLPGSSLKGALLTGWLFGEGWETLSQTDQANLLQAGFTGFDVSLHGKTYQYLTERNTEWGLKDKEGLPNLLSERLWIGDIELNGDMEIRRAQRTVKKNGGPYTLSAWIECITTGAAGSMFGRFREESDGPRTIETLCRRCNTFAKCLIVAEQQFADYCINKRYLERRPKAYAENGFLLNSLSSVEQMKNSCIVRIGWASNKNASSLTLLNSSANLSWQPPNSERRRPKSRWSLKDGTLNDGMPLGWCLLTFEEDDYDKDS
jgi:RAMP superfamily protein